MKRTSIYAVVLFIFITFTFLVPYQGSHFTLETISWAADSGELLSEPTAEQTTGQTTEQSKAPLCESTANETPQTAEETANVVLVPPPRGPQPTVWMVHGFQGLEQDFSNEFITLRQIYQLPVEAPCITRRWDAPAATFYKLRGAWKKAIEDHLKAAEDLFSNIKKMPKEEQQNLILVGHSLGGGVVIHALAKCAKENIKIDHFLLLGAAIDNDDPGIELALNATTNRSYNLVNMQDAALATYRLESHTPETRTGSSAWLLHGYDVYKRFTTGSPALGTGYYSMADGTRLCELAFEMGVSHDAADYLENFKKCVEKNQYTSEVIVVPQDWPYNMTGAELIDWLKSKLPDWWIFNWAKLPWIDLEEMDGWVLQQGGITWGTNFEWQFFYSRILSPEKRAIAWGGNEARIAASFEKVKAQLAKNAPVGQSTNPPAVQTNAKESSKDLSSPTDDLQEKTSNSEETQPAPKKDDAPTPPEDTDDTTTNARSWTEFLTGWAVWKTLDSHDGWRLQQKRFSDKCRILNPNGHKTAEGNEETLRSAFEKQKPASGTNGT